MRSELLRLAAKYVWWQPPERAVERRALFLCQLMQLGTWEDVRAVRQMLGDRALQEALASAPPGILDGRSWTYWNRFFGREPVPPLPVRPLPP